MDISFLSTSPIIIILILTTLLFVTFALLSANLIKSNSIAVKVSFGLLFITAIPAISAGALSIQEDNAHSVEAAHLLKKNYGISMSPDEAIQLIQDSKKEGIAFKADMDGEATLLWAEVTDDTFTVYRNDTAKLIEVAPKY